MFEAGINTTLALAAVGLLTAIAVGGILTGLVLLYSGSRRRVRARVRQFVREEGEVHGDNMTVREQQREALFADLDRRWENRSLFKAISLDLEAADLRLTATEFVLIQIGVGVLLGLALWTVVPVVGTVLLPVGFVMGIIFTRSYIQRMARRRITRFEEQLPNNLAVLAGSVRGGFSLFQALQLIAREAIEPSRTEFTRVVQEVSLGNTMGTALEGLSKRIPTEDVDILVTAITMQQQTGGNLTHVLDVVATTIRERQRVRREIKTLTSQQRFSAILLAALPFVLAGAMYFISPDYISNLFQPGWVLCMPIGAFILSIIGFFVMRRMSEIDV